MSYTDFWQWLMKQCGGNDVLVGSSQAAPMAQHQQHTDPTSAGWKRLRCRQILYPINVLGGRPLCYPFPSPRNLLLWGRRLNCQPATWILALPCFTCGRVHGDLSACYLPSIRISLVASARYHMCSLSHDIAVMYGWRSISRYRLIDIIPTLLCLQ